MNNVTFSYRKELPVDDRFDLVVCGGGPAGFAAAVSAARLGAKVALLEATGALGGMGTNGLVTGYDPMADGEKCINRGLPLELMEKMLAQNELPHWSQPKHWRSDYLMPVWFKPEEMKRAKDEIAEQAGVRVMYFTRLVDADADAATGTVRGVVVAQVDGLRYLRAKAFVDASGDAALAWAAGAKCHVALRDTENVLPCTLCFIVANIREPADNPSKYAEQALRDGFFSQPEVRFVPSPIGPGILSFNAGHVFRVDATNPDSLSDAMTLGRKIVAEHVAYLKKYVPGYAACELVSTAPLLGVRESRRIVGEYELTWGDLTSARQFPDQIGVCTKEVDVHAYSLSPEDQAWVRLYRRKKVGYLPRLKAYGVPYGVIVPKGWTNLWVAGRALSADQLAHSSARGMPPSSLTGQAAGAAAVQHLRTGQRACELDTEQLVTTLRAQGAWLPQETLSRTMTRGQGWAEPLVPVCNVTFPTAEEIAVEVAKVPRPTSGAAKVAGTRTTETADLGVEPVPISSAKAVAGTPTGAAELCHACDEIDRTCCRTRWVDADEHLAAARRVFSDGGAAPEAIDEARRTLAVRLDEVCCHSAVANLEKVQNVLRA